jgi:nitrite reductase/ring-hydroxylating ferredoxin subunit/DMSO/TMAO reductase YedYZ heme-binding membrane subunit
MGLEYRAVQWNRQKRNYDFVLLAGVGAFLVLFSATSKALFPFVTDEILLIRAFGAAALVLLHVILCIGPLCRLNPKFLPLLYNRRHAGVTMCLLGLVHAVLVVITYHAGGDTSPLLSIFKGSPLTGSIAGVPFQPFGFFALIILLLMAATSHDFWLANLSAPVWKSLHMLVYVAYGLLVLHVTFGVLQAEGNPVYVAVTAAGVATVLGLHITAAIKERRLDLPLEKLLMSGHRARPSLSPRPSPSGRGGQRIPTCEEMGASTSPNAAERFSIAPRERAAVKGYKTVESRSAGDSPEAGADDGFVEACAVTDIPEKRARLVCLSGERVAIFKYDGKISAVSNVCQHQNGPLGEGKILDGCITCPWHGYQYLPDTGASPPPFVEKVPTFNVRVKDGRVFVHPQPNPPGTRAEPAMVNEHSGRGLLTAPEGSANGEALGPARPAIAI